MVKILRRIGKILGSIVKGYFLWALYYLWKPYRVKKREEAKRRIGICETCEYFDHHFRACPLCGCLMDVKTKSTFKLDKNGISIDGCLIKKW